MSDRIKCKFLAAETDRTREAETPLTAETKSTLSRSPKAGCTRNEKGWRTLAKTLSETKTFSFLVWVHLNLPGSASRGKKGFGHGLFLSRVQWEKCTTFALDMMVVGLQSKSSLQF